MVVICDLPRLSTGVTQDRVAMPSICTVQAPHWAIPQPNFVPVMPSTSRNTQRSGMSAGASNDFCSPLIVSLFMRDPMYGRNARHDFYVRTLQAVGTLRHQT